MSHTKGPWYRENEGRVVAKPEGFRPTREHPVFVVANNVYLSGSQDEQKANSYLIAAAPSLLHALEEVETHLDSIRQGFVSLAIRADNEADASYYDHEINACASYSELIRAAIAKAKGE